jgi:ankyrin repeat protein
MKMNELFRAAHAGDLPAVRDLLAAGHDPNAREDGDNTTPMHWAAAAGHLDVVRALADAGGDVIGSGDDHELTIIGWATAWDGCDNAAHRAVADFLVSRGARHTIISAVAFGLEDEVRQIASQDPTAVGRAMSHNEGFQLPLHFAVRKNLPRMVELLLELGADPDGRDGSGYGASAYATEARADRAILEWHRTDSKPGLLTAVALGDWVAAEKIVEEDSTAVNRDGILHLMSKRGDRDAVEWLLRRGSNPNALWNHWDAIVTPMHLAALFGHAAIVRILLDSGADPTVHDSMHDSDPRGWAEHAGRLEVIKEIERD